MSDRSLNRAVAHLALLLIPTMTLSLSLVTVHAGSTSDLTVDNIWLEDASQPGQPISQVSSGQSFLIVATIKNIGQETASGYYLDVYYDSDYGRGGPDNILAGEVQTWYVGPLTAQDGTHTTKWVADPDNQIAELDETNNEKDHTFTVGSQTATTTATSGSTSSNPASSTSTLTLISTAQGTQFLTSILTTTVTSYTGTETSTSTIVVPTTVTMGPSVSTSTLETTQFMTSTGTTAVTGYTTTTLTSYTGTETLMSTIVVPATVTIGGSASALTVQTTQVLTSTGTTTVTAYTTTRLSSYTATTTSTGTSVVYTTVSKSAAAVAVTPSPLIYVGFLSLLGVAVAHRGTARKVWRIPWIALTFVQMMSSVREGISSGKPLTAKSLDNGAVV